MQPCTYSPHARFWPCAQQLSTQPPCNPAQKVSLLSTFAVQQPYLCRKTHYQLPWLKKLPCQSKSRSKGQWPSQGVDNNRCGYQTMSSVRHNVYICVFVWICTSILYMCACEQARTHNKRCECQSACVRLSTSACTLYILQFTLYTALYFAFVFGKASCCGC